MNCIKFVVVIITVLSTLTAYYLYRLFLIEYSSFNGEETQKKVRKWFSLNFNSVVAPYGENQNKQFVYKHFFQLKNTDLVLCLAFKSMWFVQMGIISYLNNPEKCDLEKLDWGKVYEICGYPNWGGKYPPPLLPEEDVYRHTDLQLMTVTREPVEKLISGYLDICIVRKLQVPRTGCYGCGENFTCFIMENYKQIKALQTGAVKKKRFETENHFYPENWQCQYSRLINRYDFIKYAKEDSFYEAIRRKLRAANVPEKKLEVINYRLRHTSTPHSTSNHSIAKEHLQKVLENNPQLIETIIMTYFYDFEITHVHNLLNYFDKNNKFHVMIS